MPSEQEKRALAFESVWPIDVAAEYFDVSPVHVRKLMQLPDASCVNRFDLEKRLVRENLISLDRLALEFGVPRDALERGMRQPPPNSSLAAAPLQLDAYAIDGFFLLPRRVAEAWVKALLPGHKVWSSLDSRARDLAAQLDANPRECAVSRRFSESPAAVATCRCVVTWDVVSRAHQEYLENGKHLSLEPDHVGWHAIYEQKIQPSHLWRPDLGNLHNYLERLGVPWKAA